MDLDFKGLKFDENQYMYTGRKMYRGQRENRKNKHILYVRDKQMGKWSCQAL